MRGSKRPVTKTCRSRADALRAGGTRGGRHARERAAMSAQAGGGAAGHLLPCHDKVLDEGMCDGHVGSEEALVLLRGWIVAAVGEELLIRALVHQHVAERPRCIGDHPSCHHVRVRHDAVHADGAVGVRDTAWVEALEEPLVVARGLAAHDAAPSSLQLRSRQAEAVHRLGRAQVVEDRGSPVVVCTRIARPSKCLRVREAERTGAFLHAQRVRPERYDGVWAAEEEWKEGLDVLL